MKSRCITNALVILPLMLAAVTVLGQMTANFEGGNGADQVDQYPGRPGDGWADRWLRYGSGSAEISDANPLNEGGRYLSSSASGGLHGVRRPHRMFHGDVPLNGPYTISFDFRVDTLPERWGTNSDLRIHLFDSVRDDVDVPWEHSSWVGIAYGGSDRGNWEFVDLKGTADKGWNSHDTGVAVESGVVYGFEITLYPGTTAPDYDPEIGPTYDLTIRHPGGTHQARGLGMRNYDGPGRSLHWNIQGGRGGATGFSLDSIRIVPHASARPETAEDPVRAGMVEQRAGTLETEESSLESFLGEPQFELVDLFRGGRFPDLLATTDGTMLAAWGAALMVWGETNQRWVRRSADGGQTWGERESLPAPLCGCVVDETTGDILFVSLESNENLQWRSRDGGLTWDIETFELIPNAEMQRIDQSGTRRRVSYARATSRNDGYWMRTSMGEHGITLRHGPHKGRLIMYAAMRPHSTVHPSDRISDDIIRACALYSDDGGATWRVSDFLPEGYTEEAAIAELHDGRLYYNSRSHKGFHNKPIPEGGMPEEYRYRRTAWSDDGGETWKDLEVSRILPDGGGYNKGYGMMGGLVRLPVQGQDILLFSNTDTRGGAREKMTVWGSFDGGKTWPVKRLVYAGPSAYSSMETGRPGTPSEGWVFLLFEGGDRHRYAGGKLARFNLAWLLEGERTGDGELPDWLAKRPAASE